MECSLRGTAGLGAIDAVAACSSLVNEVTGCDDGRPARKQSSCLVNEAAGRDDGITCKEAEQRPVGNSANLR
jgi:hypothetical protein